MTSVRLTACAAVVAGLALTPDATGAGKVCHLVVDAKNDQRDANVTQRAHTPGSDLDLVGGDVASNDHYVTAVFRLATLRERRGDPGTGGVYRVRFRVSGYRGNQRGMVVTYGADGQRAWAEGHDHQGWIGPAYAEINPDRGEIRISASASLLGVTKGKRIFYIEMTTAENWGPSGDYSLAREVTGDGYGPANIVDRGETKRAYVAGTPSCVAVKR